MDIGSYCNRYVLHLCTLAGSNRYRYVGFIGKGSIQLPLAVVITFAAVAVILGGVWLYASNQAQAAMYAGTRAEAPTWWQQHRSDVGINAAFSVVFLILGAVIGHYWH